MEMRQVFAGGKKREKCIENLKNRNVFNKNRSFIDKPILRIGNSLVRIDISHYEYSQ